MKKKPTSGKLFAESSTGFNPCSNGMKKELDDLVAYGEVCSFNPCSNGMKKELN